MSRADNLTLSCLNVGNVLASCRDAAARFSEQTGHTVRVVAADTAGRSALENYRTLMDVGSPRLDVIQLSESWVPALAPDLATLGTIADPDQVPAALTELGEANGRIVAWPQHIAVTLLYVRGGIAGAEPFDDWSDLRGTLLDLPDDGADGLVFGGAGSTMFPLFLDWFYSFGGQDLSDRRTLTAALQLLNDTIGVIAAPGLVDTTAGDAMAEFTAGRSAALVARSTTFDSVSTSQIGEDLVTILRPNANADDPTTPRLVSTWLVGVPRFSPNQESAKQLAAFLVSDAEERRAAVEFGVAPARTALFEDPEVHSVNPIMANIAESLPFLTPLPVDKYGEAYLDLADGVAETVREMLRGDTDGATAASTIVRMVRAAERRSE
ncbi:extracellular solute-binding protein [Acuticoccus sp. M5D2P5]|uniref:extracellular solute-binding protein n=1 Tax=Acuticoccus kalidii TaxID=2910977 RepID=UPI001F2BBFE0|nr:extracellular solute-binding protein [Acuticoccus kalidii]MCF3932714.1 extracellular solute-binding protein [Acuticoccus kalidii]